METTEHRAVQTIVAEYNRISASLFETPKDHRSQFTSKAELAHPLAISFRSSST